jgi:hypothetical protein
MSSGSPMPRGGANGARAGPIPSQKKDGVFMRPFIQLLSAALVVLAPGAACKNDSGVTGPMTLAGQYMGTMAGESSPI